MNLSKLTKILSVVFLSFCGEELIAQSGSLTVPTPSFSSPGTSASSTTVPASGTALRPLKPVRLPSLNPLYEQAPNALSKSQEEEAVKATESVEEKPQEVEMAVTSTSPPPKKKVALSKPPKNQAVRIDMLEKIGDQLSLRMRAMKQREEALSQREEALIERESKASEREKMIRQIEESLLEREATVRKREQLPPPQVWRGEKAPSVYARYAAVLDGRTMQFFHTKNATAATPVASTQKLMTALVICAEGSLDEIVVVPREATQVEPTVVGIKTGERYTRRQLLTALLVRSGNDLAAALAIDNAGSVEAFCQKMNLMGKKIGLINSNFKTPHGLPAPGQYSCARDIGIVAFEAYQNPEIRDIVKQKSYRFHFNDDRSLLLTNTNRILREWEHCNGMKTGFTYAAGKCLVCSANIGGEHRISVVIKDTNAGVWSDSKNLLDWALNLEMLGPMDGFDS